MKKSEPDQDAAAVALLRTLAQDPPAPTGVDPVRAIVDGKRRRRNRRLTGAVTVSMLTTAAALAAPTAVGYVRGGAVPLVDQPADRPSATVPAPPTATAPGPAPVMAPISVCTVQRLPTGKHREAITTGGDPGGRYLLGRSYPGNGTSLLMLIWRDGKLIQQFPLPGQDSALQDINTAGLAVGYTYAPMKPYVVRNGSASVLPGVANGQAFAINERGVIVGVRHTDAKSIPVRWASVEKPATDLPLPATAKQGEASGIFDDGTVVGVITDRDGSQYGWLWLPDGSSRRMAVPANAATRGAEFQVRGAHNGWVVGMVGKTHYRYRVADNRFERLPDGINYPEAVSAAGWLVASGRQDDGLLWMGVGKPKSVPLPAPKDFATKPPPFTSVVSISDDGRVVGGHSSEYGGDNTALLWRCG